MLSDLNPLLDSLVDEQLGTRGRHSVFLRHPHSRSVMVEVVRTHSRLVSHSIARSLRAILAAALFAAVEETAAVRARR